jgi:hypothetical protein
MKERRPITFKQLRAIATRVMLRDLTIQDDEWKEATKVELIRQGWAYPSPELMGQALSAVERALEKQRGPRPTGMQPRAEAVEVLQQADPPWRGQDRERRNAAVRDLVQRISNNSDRGLAG